MEILEQTYCHSLSQLETTLARVDRPGSFCTNGELISPMPNVYVERSRLSFPVPQDQAQQLIALAERAPYSRGEDIGRS